MLIIDEVNTMSEVSTWVKKARSDEAHKHTRALNSPYFTFPDALYMFSLGMKTARETVCANDWYAVK